MKLVRIIIGTLLAFSLIASVKADPLADHVFDLVNLQRAANSLPPLTRAPELDVAALRHSEDMATNNFFGHVGSDGSTFSQRITAAGYRSMRAGENIAAGWRTAEQAVAGWMKSPGHRANILNPGYKEIGIGVAYRDGTTHDYYWTQEFGTRSAIRVPTTPTPIPQTPPIPLARRPNLISVQPRAAWSGVTALALTGSGFGDSRGTGRVTLWKMNSPVYAAVTHRTWSNAKITVAFQTPQRGWHYVQVARGDGLKSLSLLIYVR